jgi:hypothetical protein
MLMSEVNQIKIYPYTEAKKASTTFTSREYECANAFITRGATTAPNTFKECMDRFPNIKKIADEIGMTGLAWAGPEKLNDPALTKTFKDLLTGITSSECQQISTTFGPDWAGCLWGSPSASFSCSCPDIGSKYEAYLKHRLNVATFWKTPKTVPVERRQFLDLFKYLTKIEITVAGDFTIVPGDFVELFVDNHVRTPTRPTGSLMTGTFLVIAVKHVVNSGGTHEMVLSLGEMPPEVY